MRSGLFWKLFLLQVLAATAVLAGALAVSRIYSVRSFTEYLEGRERAGVQRVAAEIAKAYAETGDLKHAAETAPGLRRRLFGRSLRCAGPECPPETRYPPPGDPGAPDEHFFLSVEEGPVGHGPPRVLHFRSGDEAEEGGLTVAVDGPVPPLQLQDANGAYLRGRPGPMRRGHREPITVDGRIVGYLAWARFPGHPEQAEFARKQAQRFAVIGPVALALAALFAAVITGLIMRPIRQLSSGTAALARREFRTRLPAGRRDELGQLAADFNGLAEALDGYDTRQRQWLADIAHELRTPLSVLRGELEAMLDGVRAAGPDRLRSLHEEVGRLTRLVQDLQLVSLAESGGLRLVPVETDMSDLAWRAAARFREQFGKAGFEFRPYIESGLRATVDRQRFEQVLANLLENVLRHAAPPGPVVLSVRSEDAQVVVSVADAGPGVPPQLLGRLFDRLYRVDSARTRPDGGAGLGLSICKSIVEAHGGSIVAQDSARGGLELVIRLSRTKA